MYLKKYQIESTKLALNNTDQIIDIKANPAVKTTILSIVKAVPIVGELVDTTIDKVLTNYQEKKRNQLLDIILSDGERITSEMVSDVEFIINFARTLESINRLATNDKVEFFANLLKNGYFTDHKITNSEFEEYQELIKELSYREIYILVAYNKSAKLYYNKYNKSTGYREDTLYKDMVKDVTDRFNINCCIIEDILARLENRGLCVFNMGNSYSEEITTVSPYETPYYTNFEKIILSDS